LGAEKGDLGSFVTGYRPISVVGAANEAEPHGLRGVNYVDIVDEQDRATPEFETGVTIFFAMAKPVRVPQIGPARGP
jgi:hypothetical protein